MERHAKVSGGGYSGIRDVTVVPPTLDDSQPSWLLAETFKYLFLLFSEDSVLDLNEFVLNTEAHPLRVFGEKRKEEEGAEASRLFASSTTTSSQEELGRQRRRAAQQKQESKGSSPPSRRHLKP